MEEGRKEGKERGRREESKSKEDINEKIIIQSSTEETQTHGVWRSSGPEPEKSK